MWVLSRVTPPRLRDVTPLAYGATLVPLLLVLAIGTGRYGSHWIDLKLFYFQPSELLKLSLPMMAAWYLDRQLLPPRVGAVLATGVIIAVPTALVRSEEHTSELQSLMRISYAVFCLNKKHLYTSFYS